MSSVDVDLVIVGAGPVGLFGAYYAGVRGLTVAVVDSLSEVGGQVTAMYPEKQIFDIAGTGRIGAVNCDGTHALGVFWSRVLDWPLVWDQGEETAIQSPNGGSKFTWSGPPLMARDTPERISFQLAAQGPEDLARLVELGAIALGGGRFLDPDGNEFIVTSG